MTTLYLIRHAEAEGNLYRRIQGQWDGEITPRGKRQIEALAERFRDVPLDAVYSSDLRRTIETAGAILRYHDLPLQTTPRLREIYMGAWEGLAWGDADHAEPEQMFYFNHDPARWQIPGAEPYAVLEARMTSALRDIAARHPGGTVAVVSHGTAIRTYLAARLGIASGEIGTLAHGDNTCVAKLEFENGAVHVAYHNDASHLPEELSTFTRQTWWKGVDKDPGNLRMEQMTFPRDSAFYIACYRDAWRTIHGTEEGFTAQLYLASAQKHARTRDAVMRLMSGDTPVGMIELDEHHKGADGRLWLSFLYLTPHAREQGWGVQLLGHAVWYCETRGFPGIRLHCAAANAHAQGFYEHYGFTCVGEDAGVRAREAALSLPAAGDLPPGRGAARLRLLGGRPRCRQCRARARQVGAVSGRDARYGRLSPGHARCVPRRFSRDGYRADPAQGHAHGDERLLDAGASARRAQRGARADGDVPEAGGKVRCSQHI